jgi:PAS domain S-box-containing protein
MSAIRERIFVIHDDPIAAREVGSLLERLGYVPCGSVPDPANAAGAIAALRPDLVLMKCGANDKENVAAANRLREQANLPIVLVTAAQDDALTDRVLAPEPFSTLDGALRPQEVHLAIQLAIARHQLAAVRRATASPPEPRRTQAGSAQANEARFAAFARIGADWLWETDAEDRVVFLSGGWQEDVSGLQQRLGQPRRAFAVPDPQNLARIAALEQTVARREPFHDFVYRIRFGDRARWCSISGKPVYDPTGAFVGYRGVGRDVEDEIETRRALENKTRILDAALAAIPDAVSVTNAQHQGVEWNDPLFEIFGLDKAAAMAHGDPVGYALLEMARRGEYGPGVPEELVRARRKGVIETMRTAGSLQYERQLKNGRWVEARLTAIKGGGWVSFYREVTDRKKAEIELRELNASLERRVKERTRALAESERFSSGILDSIGAHVAVLAADGRIVTTNASWKKFAADSDYPWQRAHEGENYLQALEHARDAYPEESRTAIAAIRDVAAGRIDSFEFEYPCHRPDEPRWFLCRIIRLNVAGDPQIVVSHHNVTAVHLALERAAAGERTFASLAELSPVGIFRTDPDGNCLDVNRRWCEITGVAAAEARGEGWSRALHPEDRARVYEEWTAFARSGGRFRSEHRFLRSDGTVRWVVADAIKIGDAAIGGGCIGTITDITDRKAIESELAASRDALDDALESIDRGVILYDRDDRVVIFNRVFREHFPGPAGSIRLGDRFEDTFRAAIDRGTIVVPEGTSKEAFIADRLARHRRADGQVMTRNLSDGRVLHVTERAARNGGIVGIGADVTEQLRMEEQLRAIQKMEALGQLTGGMAHDFNNYLGVIVGNLDLLKDRKSDDPIAARYVEAALEGALRGAELTQSLLSFSRRKRLDPRVTDLNTRIEGVTKLLGRTLGEGIEIAVSLAPELWPVEVDAAQFDSCILNIATNARDAMPDGGTLAIATRNEVLDDSYARLNAGVVPGAYALIEISDTGIGMSAETLQRVFEPFFTTKSAGHGTGLGLSMAYGFVKQSGGHIMIYSEPDHGTTVRIYLPRATASGVVEYVVPAHTAPAAAGSETVLVVEDNEQLRRTAVAQLTALGYRVLQAQDGHAALKILERGDDGVDLLFSDVVMPGGIDGYALASTAVARRAGLKVLLTSGFPGDTLARIGAKAKAFPLLGKPYRKDDLARAVRNALAS